MSWRTVVITKTSKLDYSMGHLVVRDVESTVKVHISEISVLVIESTAVSVTAALENVMKYYLPTNKSLLEITFLQ